MTTPTPSPRTAAGRLMATLRSEPDLGIGLSTYADLVDAIVAQAAPPDALRAALEALVKWYDTVEDQLAFPDTFEQARAALAASPSAAPAAAALAALERLFDAASVEEEDWSPATHDELVAALNQAGAALAAPAGGPWEALDDDAAIGKSLRSLTSELAVGWRIGLLRTESGWRLVLLTPEHGDPVSFLDAPDLDAVFADGRLVRPVEGT